MKIKIGLMLGLMCSLLPVTASCATHNELHSQSEMTTAEDDPELLLGDLGVEQFMSPRLQSLDVKDPAKQPLLDVNGFPLIPQSPNPSIQPVKGRYINNLIDTAKSYMGTPYVYGSERTDPSTFDCSDYTRWVFLTSLGMDLPWDSRSQASYVKAFSKRTYTSLDQAKRGDLLFFTNYRGEDPASYQGLAPDQKPISHVAIYLGYGKVIHCPSKKSGGVRIDVLQWRQLNNRFLFGGGILP